MAEIARRPVVSALLGLALSLASLGAAPAPAQPDLRSIEEALRAGRCREAAEGYVAFASKDRDPRSAQRAVEVALACRHLPAAWRAAQRLRELDPENPDALRLIGIVAMELWKIDEARGIFADLLAKPDVEFERALIEILPTLTEDDLAPAAWIVFRPLVPRDKASPRVLAELARLACGADDLSACGSLIREARERGGGRDARTVRLYAATLSALGQPALALGEAELVARGDPDNHRFARVETLVALERAEEARSELLRIAAEVQAAGASELLVEVDRRLALLALNEGDLTEAERRLRRRLASERGAAEAVFYLALISERRGEPAIAEQGYRQLIEAGAGLSPRIRLARMLLARGDAAGAMALFDELVRGGRADLVQLEIARSRVLSEADRHAEAIAAIDATLERHPDYPDLLYQRAVLLDSAGRTREAIKQLESLLAVRPDDGHVLNALGYTLADRQRELARAERLIRTALEQRPDNAAFIDSLAWVRFRRGDARGAEPLLARAWQLSREPEIAAHWGEVLWALGERDRAREVWARGRRMAPESMPLRETVERFLGESAL